MLTATGQSLTTAFDEDDLEAEFASLSVAGVASNEKYKEEEEEKLPTVSLESPAVDSKAPRKQDAFVPLRASGTSQEHVNGKKKATTAVAVPSL